MAFGAMLARSRYSSVTRSALHTLVFVDPGVGWPQAWLNPSSIPNQWRYFRHVATSVTEIQDVAIHSFLQRSL